MTEQRDRPLIFRVIKAPAADLLCTDKDKTVLLNFLDAMNPEQNGTLAWVGAEKIAERWGWNEKTVRRAIARLCELDLLKLHHTNGRVPIYAINVGLIHRLVEDGQRVQSENPARTQSPGRPDTESGQTGQRVPSDRTQSPAKNHGTTTETPLSPIPSFGSSATSEAVANDPVQRRLMLGQVIAGAAKGMRMPGGREEPTEKKQQDEPDERRVLAAGARGPKERPG